MSIILTYTNRGRARVAILRPAGALDRSNYHYLTAQACAARDAGAHHLIVDLSDVERVGTAGLVGLHAVALLARGMRPPDPESGWAAIRALAESHLPMQRLAVVNPRPPIQQTLTRAPFADLFVIHADLDATLDVLVA